VGDISFSNKEEIITKIPLALFWMGILVRNAELLQTLINSKGHLEMIQLAFNLRINQLLKYLDQ